MLRSAVFTVCCVLLLAPTAASAQDSTPNTLGPSESKQGWRLLFDGKSLTGWDAQPAGYNTGSLVGSVKASPTSIIPDEWNQFEITAEGDRFVVLLNGNKVLDARDSAHASGVVGFQCQRDQRIEFRNIKLLPHP